MIMYLLPYVLIFAYAVVFGIMNYRKINSDYIMYTYLLRTYTFNIIFYGGSIFQYYSNNNNCNCYNNTCK